MDFRRLTAVVKLLIRRLDAAVAVRLLQSANLILPYLAEENSFNLIRRPVKLMESTPPEGVCKEAVYHTVFQEVAPKLRNFSYYRTGSKEIAADIVQDAFLRLWENCAKVLPDKASAWLFRVAENIFFKQKEKEKVVRKYEWRMAGPEPTYASPEDELREKEFQEQLETAIAGLPDGAREVFLLNRMDGLKYREIAVLLNISQKAVEKRMHRALVELRELHAGI
ncbi:MAG: RNA polymerase sigma-70 factor (family 1) [Neolewinella sp.]